MGRCEWCCVWTCSLNLVSKCFSCKQIISPAPIPFLLFTLAYPRCMLGCLACRLWRLTWDICICEDLVIFFCLYASCQLMFQHLRSCVKLRLVCVCDCKGVCAPLMHNKASITWIIRDQGVIGEHWTHRVSLMWIMYVAKMDYLGLFVKLLCGAGFRLGLESWRCTHSSDYR